MSFRSPPPGEDPARAARELLAPALSELQRRAATSELHTRVLDRIASSMSALYAAEAESSTEQRVNTSLRQALDELTKALDALHERPPGPHPLDGPEEQRDLDHARRPSSSDTEQQEQKHHGCHQDELAGAQEMCAQHDQTEHDG